MQPLAIRSSINVPESQVLDQVRGNLGHPWLDRKLGTGTLSIVGGGPSLKHYLESIQGDVMALNNAHDFLIARNIIPKFAVCLDARIGNADFYRNPHPEVTYLIASQAHPDVFEALDGFKVLVWHAGAGKAVTDVIPFPHIEINGGCTVGLRSMFLAYSIGYTDLNLYGYDSSHEDYHHAYEQVMNDNQDVIEVEAAGEVFKTSPTMAKQAYQFQSAVMKLVRSGVDITVHGGGLLPTIHREMQKPVDQSDLKAVEARKYSNMWAFDEYRKYAPGEEYVETFLLKVGARSGSLIDFGTGTGRAAQKLKDHGFDVLGIDHAANCLDEHVNIDLMIGCLWNLPDLDADYGFCTDVMEHIPTEKVNDVLLNISCSVEKCFFAIHTDHDVMGSLIEDTLHLTVKPAEWWELELKKHFAIVERLPSKDALFFCS